MKLFFSQLIAKVLNLLFKYLKFGSGGTWPGYIVLTIFPNIMLSLQKSITSPIIVISGTNGKTTTSKILTNLLTYSGKKVLHNETGANLVNGIVSTLLLNMTLRNSLPFDYIVLEVDEFALPQILSLLSVDVLVLLNLSRDQLDRYGETDIILTKWKTAISTLNPNVRLIINGEQAEFVDITKDFTGTVSSFDSSLKYLHMSPLKGVFNAKNINAALCALEVLGLNHTSFLNGLASINPAYGRGERIGKYVLYLAKNPASFDHNLALLSDFTPTNSAVLIILNDNIPDGRDVSWIYDIDTKALSSLAMFENIYVSGTRCFDMAVRLKYAGVFVAVDRIDPNILVILHKLETSMVSLENIVVFPNYSGMLSFRKKLTGRSIL